MEKPRRARRVGALCLVFPALFQTVSALAQEPVTFRLKLHHMLSSLAPAHRTMLVPWAEKVSRESGGRIEIAIYPSMQLGGQAPALIDQVRDGIVEMCWTLTAYTPGRFPRVEVFELPFLNTNPIVMNLALGEFVVNHPEEFAGFKVISVFVHAGQLIHSKKPLRTANDLRGLKIRIPGRTAAWMVDAMDSTPIGAPISKTPEMLSKGIVDAVLIPFEVSAPLKVHELVDYHIVLDDPRTDRLNTQVFVIAMNLDTFNALPQDLQAVIEQNADEATARWIGQLWIDAEKPGAELAARSGTIISLPPREVAILRERVTEPVADRWVEVVGRSGIDGRALIAEARGLIEKYTRQLEQDR